MIVHCDPAAACPASYLGAVLKNGAKVSEGELPVDETIEVNINVNLLDMVLSAVVESWTEGSGEGYIGTHK